MKPQAPGREKKKKKKMTWRQRWEQWRRQDAFWNSSYCVCSSISFLRRGPCLWWTLSTSLHRRLVPSRVLCSEALLYRQQARWFKIRSVFFFFFIVASWLGRRTFVHNNLSLGAYRRLESSFHSVIRSFACGADFSVYKIAEYEVRSRWPCSTQTAKINKSVNTKDEYEERWDKLSSPCRSHFASIQCWQDLWRSSSSLWQ